MGPGIDRKLVRRHNLLGSRIEILFRMFSVPPGPIRSDVAGGLVSSALAIPLAIGFGMFAFVPLGDEYFAYGALAGLLSALIGGFVCVLLGERSTLVYAPRITTTFFLGLLLYSLVHSDNAM